MAPRLTIIGKILWYSYAIELYENGDGSGLVWNWWHPLSWIHVPIFMLIYGFKDGFPAMWYHRSEIGLRVDPYFIRNPDKLKWRKRYE